MKDKMQFFDSFKAALKGERMTHRAPDPKPVNFTSPKTQAILDLLNRGESLSLRAIREAIGPDAWDSIMLDKMHKRLLMGHSKVQQALVWSKIVSAKSNAKDFRYNYAIRTGNFSTLDEVPAGAPYPEVEFSDEDISYKVAKYGAIFPLQFESLKNDDLGALGNAVERFGVASGQTIEKFVLETLIDDNPTIYDGNSLFDSSSRSQSNKLGTSKALSASTLEEAIVQMRTFTDLDGEPLNIPPKYLLVSPADEFTALKIVNSDLTPGTANNDINVLKGRVEVLVSSRITSSRWYLIADPTVFDTIELGFLGGRQDPEIFEEQANSGHNFAYDAIRYKCRLIFGGANLDWRWIVGANF